MTLPARLLAHAESHPATHDYTRRTWGHDYCINTVHYAGRRLSMAGWGEGIKAGDYLILPNGNATTRYQVEAIDYKLDPRDMWFAEVLFAPRAALPSPPKEPGQ